jgi:hypothetical protein
MDDTQVKPLHIKTLKNGAEYDLDRGRIVSSKNATTKITSANAGELSRKRHEANRRAAVKRILGEAQSIDPSIQTPADAYGLLVASQYTKLLDSDKPNVEQIERLGKMLTGMDLNSQRENASAPGTITADPDTLMQLISALEREKQIAVDRARAIDVTSTDTRNE